MQREEAAKIFYI